MHRDSVLSTEIVQRALVYIFSHIFHQKSCEKTENIYTKRNIHQSDASDDKRNSAGGVQCKSAVQECTAGVKCGSALQECRTGVQCTIAMQYCTAG